MNTEIDKGFMAVIHTAYFANFCNQEPMLNYRLAAMDNKHKHKSEINFTAD